MTGDADRLAAQQAALIQALVAGGPPPPGFDPARVDAIRAALLRKRSGEVAAVWPVLAATYGPQWNVDFGRWAAGRPPVGALRDGWDFARSRPSLSKPAAEELAVREVTWRYDGGSAPRRRRTPAVRGCHGVLLVQAGGRVRRIALRKP
jgi:hypothetical protein